MDSESKPDLSNLETEIHDVFVGALMAATKDRNSLIGASNILGLTRQQWKQSARRLLMARRTAILEALSTPTLEEVSNGNLDLQDAVLQAVDIVAKRAAESTIRCIASRRLDIQLDQARGDQVGINTGALHAALMDAFFSGLNFRSS